MRRVIITGANGFIGSSLVSRMVADGIGVVAVDTAFPGNRLPDSDLITRVCASAGISLGEKIPEDEYDAFYHLAWKGVNGAEKSDPLVQGQNIQTALECAVLSQRIRARRYLCSGTVAENAVSCLPNLPHVAGGMLYGAAKHACRLMLETYCKSVGITFVWMQFGNVYGVGNRTGNLLSYVLERLLSGKEASFGPAAQPYDFVNVRDLVEAIYRLGFCANPRSCYYIGSGNPCLLRDVLARVGSLCGHPELILLGKRADDGIRYRSEMFDTRPLIADIGAYVSTDFDLGVQEMVDWLKREGGTVV